MKIVAAKEDAKTPKAKKWGQKDKKFNRSHRENGEDLRRRVGVLKRGVHTKPHGVQ